MPLEVHIVRTDVSQQGDARHSPNESKRDQPLRLERTDGHGLIPFKKTFQFYAQVAGDETLKNAEEADRFG